MAVSHVFSSPVADFTGTVTVFDSNGATATTNATALVRPSNWNSVHNQFMTISGNTAGASTASGTNLVLQGGNNVTLSVTDQTIIFSASQSQSVQTQNMVSILGSTGNISFANGNGVTFGGNASTVTASHNGLTSQSNQAFSANGGSSAFQTLVFADSQGISWSNSNGSVVGTVKTDYAASDHSHGNPTLALTNLSGTTASNSAGLTLSLSAAAPGGGAAFSAGISGGNTSGDTGTVSNQIVFAGGNNITVSGSTNAGGMSVTISGANAGGAQTGISGIVVSNTTYTSGTVTFQNANGISFGSSGANGISASYTVPTVTNSSWTVSDNGTSGTVGRLAFTNLNGVTLSLSTGAAGLHTIVGSHNALTSQSNQAVSAGNGSYAFQTLSFSNANGISFGTSAGSAITASHNALTTARASNDAIGLNTAQSNVTWTVNSSGLSLDARGYAGTGTTFNGANISASMTMNSVGLQISASVAAGGGVNSGTFYATGNTTQSSSGTIALSSIIVRGTGGVSAGISNGSVVVSGPDLTSISVTGALSASSNGSTISLGVGTVTASATSNTTQGSSGTINLNGLIFQGAGAASVGISNGSVVISAPNAGAGNVTFSAGANSAGLASIVFSNSNGVSFGLNGSTITASAAGGGGGIGAGVSTMGNTAGSTGTVTTGNVILVGSGPISLSQSTGAAGSAATITINAPATSSLVGTNGISISTNGSTISISQVAFTRSYYNPQDGYLQVAGQQGQGSLHIQPAQAPHVQFDRIIMPIVNTNSSNSSGSHTLSFWFGIYTRNASTLSLSTSTSSSTAVTHSGTAGSYSLYSGIRMFSIPMTLTLAESQYWIGILSRTTSGGANGTYSQILCSQLASSVFGHFGSSVNASVQYTRGLGVYTATTNALPNSIGFSEISGASNSLVLRQPMFYVVSGTV